MVPELLLFLPQEATDCNGVKRYGQRGPQRLDSHGFGGDPSRRSKRKRDSTLEAFEEYPFSLFSAKDARPIGTCQVCTEAFFVPGVSRAGVFVRT